MTDRSPQLSGISDDGLATPNQGEPELVIVATPDDAARLATERIVRAILAAVNERGRADFCTTGGGTPIPIYKALSQPPLRDEIPWPAVHFWWGDDRFVPRGNPESNVTSLDEILLRAGAFSGESGEGVSGSDVEAGEAAGVLLPPANVHPYPTDRALAENRDNEWCARRYAEELATVLPVTPGNWPVFDLILLGVGDDGHCLSCFPNSPTFDRDDWAMGVPAPTHVGPHIDRVTLNPRVLETGPVLVVTWGANKAEALGHVFGDVRDDRRWPVQRTRRPGVTWIADEAAAALIGGDRRRGG